MVLTVEAADHRENWHVDLRQPRPRVCDWGGRDGRDRKALLVEAEMVRERVTHHLVQPAHHIRGDVLGPAVRPGREALERFDPPLLVARGLRALPGGEDVEHPWIVKVWLARAGAADDECGHSVRVLESDVNGGGTAHRQANQHRAVDREGIEEFDDVVAAAVWRGGCGGRECGGLPTYES